MLTICKYIVITLLVSILAGCGFHLRGHTPLPPELKVMYLQTNAPYSDFTKQLKLMLNSAKVTLVDEQQAAPITLQILSAADSQLLTSSSASGQTNTYALNYTVIYQLLNNRGQVIEGPQTVITTRNYSVTSNQVLGDTTVQNALLLQMQRDAIYQMINRLRTPQLLKALAAQAKITP